VRAARIMVLLLAAEGGEPPRSPRTIESDRADADEVLAMIAYENPVDYTGRVDSHDNTAILWGTRETFWVWMKDTLSAELTQLED
jgi:hypothetical protein